MATGRCVLCGYLPDGPLPSGRCPERGGAFTDRDDAIDPIAEGAWRRQCALWALALLLGTLIAVVVRAIR